MEVDESIGRAVATAGSAVVFAGMTVVIALVGLLITGIPFLAAMGLGAAFTVVVAVLVALTLLPARLGFLGQRAANGKRTATDATPLGERWARVVSRRRIVATLLVAVVLVVAAAAAVSRLYAGPEPRLLPVGAEVLALGGLAYVAPVAFEGLPVVVAWAALAVALAVLSERGLVLDEGFASAAFVGLAAAHTLVLEAPPIALRDGVGDLGVAAAAIAATAAAALASQRFAPDPVDRVLAIAGAIGTIYLPSVAIVDLTATGELEAGQTPQVLLSAFWSAAGLAAIVFGLMRGDRRFRLGGLALLGVAAAKVVVYDLSELDEIYRVLSFVALGLLLLAGGFAYQRMRTVAGDGG
jgi:uncharacterized membrane protein